MFDITGRCHGQELEHEKLALRFGREDSPGHPMLKTKSCTAITEDINDQRKALTQSTYRIQQYGPIMNR